MRLAGLALAAFVAIVVVQHLLVPGLDPERHMISEYANARAGWLMTCGFLAWALSWGLTAALVWPRSRVIAVLLAVVCAGVILVAAFATQTSAGVLPPGVRRTTAGRLHDLGSGVLALAQFVAVAVSAVVFPRLRRLALALLVSTVVVDVALLAVGPTVGGIRQRALVLASVVWQAALLHLLKAERATS